MYRDRVRAVIVLLAAAIVLALAVPAHALIITRDFGHGKEVTSRIGEPYFAGTTSDWHVRSTGNQTSRLHHGETWYTGYPFRVHWTIQGRATINAPIHTFAASQETAPKWPASGWKTAWLPLEGSKTLDVECQYKLDLPHGWWFRTVATVRINADEAWSSRTDWKVLPCKPWL